MIKEEEQAKAASTRRSPEPESCEETPSDAEQTSTIDSQLDDLEASATDEDIAEPHLASRSVVEARGCESPLTLPPAKDEPSQRALAMETPKARNERKRSGPVSPKKIEANRRNAQLSKGPKTVAGKQRSRRNAIKHGILTCDILICDESVEDRAAFNEMHGRLRHYWAPFGEMEEFLVETIAVCRFRLARVLRFESISSALESQRVEDDVEKGKRKEITDEDLLTLLAAMQQKESTLLHDPGVERWFESDMLERRRQVLKEFRSRRNELQQEVMMEELGLEWISERFGKDALESMLEQITANCSAKQANRAKSYAKPSESLNIKRSLYLRKAI
jgi:hypothetical protein